VSHFKHASDLGELRRLRETSELVGSYCQIGAWSLEDVMAVDEKKFFVEVTVERERSSLRVKPIIPSSLGPHDSCLVFSPLRVVDVPVFLSNALLLGFAVPRRAIDADVEDRTTPEGWKEKLIREDFGKGLRRALRLGAQSLFRDGLEVRPAALA
jgi:hypothetical protein